MFYVSDDRASKEALRSAVEVQTTGSLEPLARSMEASSWEPARDLLETYEQRTYRAYTSDDWSHENRTELIRRFEEELFAT